MLIFFTEVIKKDNSFGRGLLFEANTKLLGNAKDQKGIEHGR